MHLLKPFATPSPSPARHPVRALVLTPTRELAVQISESCTTYGKHLPLRIRPSPARPVAISGGLGLLIATCCDKFTA